MTIGRYKKSGWFYDSERHSLARQGVKTALPKIGYAIGKGVYNTVQTTAQGLTATDKDLEDEGDAQLLYSPVTVSAPEEKTESVMADVDDVLAEESHEVEYPEQELGVDIGDDLKEEKTTGTKYSDGVDSELSEVESSMEGGVVSRSWIDKTRDFVKEKLQDMFSSAQDNDPEKLSASIGSIEAHKQLLKDKIGIIEHVKRNIQSDKYREEQGISKQLESLSKVNKYVEQLSGEVASIDSKIMLGKKHLQHIYSNPIAQQTAQKKSFGFGDVFGFGFGDELIKEREQKKQAGRARVPEKKSSSIFPSFEEMLDPSKIK